MRLLIVICDRCGLRDERVIVGNKTGAPIGWRTFSLSEVIKEHPYSHVVGKIHCCPSCATWNGVEAIEPTLIETREPLRLASGKAGRKGCT